MPADTGGGPTPVEKHAEEVQSPNTAFHFGATLLHRAPKSVATLVGLRQLDRPVSCESLIRLKSVIIVGIALRAALPQAEESSSTVTKCSRKNSPSKVMDAEP
jgi:hypothetical protein